MVVEETKASADDGLGIDRPSEADARREIVSLVEGGIVVPAQARVYGEIVPNFPVVLNPEAVIVVAEMDFVGLGCEPAARKQQKEAGINWAKLLVVGLCGKELILLAVGFDAIDLGSLEIPAEFDGVTPKSFGEAGAKGCVLLIQIGRRKRSAELRCSQVAEYPAGVETAEDIEDRVGTSFRMCGAGKSGFVAILATKTKDERAAGIAEGHGVAETQEEIAITKIGACGRE